MKGVMRDKENHRCGAGAPLAGFCSVQSVISITTLFQGKNYLQKKLQAEVIADIKQYSVEAIARAVVHSVTSFYGNFAAALQIELHAGCEHYTESVFRRAF